MTLKKIWMSSDTARKSRYGLRTLGGVVGIVALMLVLITGGVFLSFRLGLPRELFSLVLVCGGTALAAVLALRLGWRGVRDATVFFLTEDDRLYVLDARYLFHHGGGPAGYAADAMETQRFLRRLAQSPGLPSRAREIRKVDGLRENRRYYAIRCRVGLPGGRAAALTCFLVKGTGDEELLLRQLERRESWEFDLEPALDRKPFFLLVSALTLAGLTALCALSHPAVGRLPAELYFPCLCGAFLALVCLVCLLIRRRRGE